MDRFTALVNYLPASSQRNIIFIWHLARPLAQHSVLGCLTMKIIPLLQNTCGQLRVLRIESEDRRPMWSLPSLYHIYLYFNYSINWWATVVSLHLAADLFFLPRLVFVNEHFWNGQYQSVILLNGNIVENLKWNIPLSALWPRYQEIPTWRYLSTRVAEHGCISSAADLKCWSDCGGQWKAAWVDILPRINPKIAQNDQEFVRIFPIPWLLYLL